MSRREIREHIFQILFRIEFHQEEDLPEQLLYENAEAGEEDAAYIQQKIQAVAEKKEEIDEMINAIARGWKTTRMGKVDLTLIRLGVYEMKFDDEIPTGVAINEAVELAKKYGTDGSSSFVNGILAKLV
ncbi:MAG: transcription antitermination factor NusB [Eubacterium sp.]|nr:transcription antitermination factor NusB [Eubacterium sp.]